MRNIVIMIIALLVLGGGGCFGWRQFNAEQPESAPEIPYGSLEGQPLYIELDPLTAPFVHTMATMRNPDQAMINIRRVKSRLLANADAVLGAGVVRGVLVQLAQ